MKKRLELLKIDNSLKSNQSKYKTIKKESKDSRNSSSILGYFFNIRLSSWAISGKYFLWIHLN